MNELKIPKVITIGSDKGGTGKSRYAILLLRCLAAAGYKVLGFDFDTSTHSLTNFFLKSDEETLKKANKSHNCAMAIFYPDNTLNDYALKTDYNNIDLIPFSRALSAQRTIEYHRLEKIISHTSGYDFIIIDCAPAYDNFKCNAICAANYIITPCLQDNDSFNSAISLRGEIMSEMFEKLDFWFITVNGYNKRWEDAEAGKQKEYIDRYENEFEGHITPRSCWFPWTKDMNDINDRRLFLSDQIFSNAVKNKALYDAVCNLAECFIDEDVLSRPEKI